MVSINKKCKTKENPNGTIKIWKLKKVKNKNEKNWTKNGCHNNKLEMR